MVTHLPSSQFLRDAKEAQARGKDPVLFLQALVKYWEMEMNLPHLNQRLQVRFPRFAGALVV